MLSVVNFDSTTAHGCSLIDEIVREGARRMPAAALEAEVNSHIAELADDRDEKGRSGHRTRERRRQEGAYDAVRQALTDDEISAAIWVAITINAFNRVCIMSKHPVRVIPQQ